MEIVKKYGPVTKAQLFNMSRGNGCTLLKNVETGTQFEVRAAVIMHDDKKTPEGEIRTKEILHILTTTGEIYTTESPTVIDTFKAAVDTMETHELSFELFRGKSKSGRNYMDLTLLTLDESESTR